jgi:glycosyltransferase involved in cell wall biosynthesis
MRASVIICTRNPKRDRLAELARALGEQTAPAGSWDLLVVDNGSAPPVGAEGFPPFVRIVREEREGLTPARLRGIRESRCELLVFFDDDNVPNPDFLAQALALFGERPGLGAAGGRIDGVFEAEPPRRVRPYLGWLAVRPWVTRDRETGPGEPWGWLPCGAGFCLRADAAARYAAGVTADAARLALGRRGAELTGSEDTDMALTAIEMGYKALLTPRLGLRHHIPASRLEAGYLERLLEGSAFSTACLAKRRGLRGKPLWVNRILRRAKRVAAAHPADWGFRLRLERAIDRGEIRGRELSCVSGLGVGKLTSTGEDA